MSRALRWYDYITINIYFLGLTTLAQTNGLVIPILVQRFVGEAGKASFFGTLRLWSLMIALLVQAAAGMISDRSRLRWGRRRPFILAGTLVDLAFISLIGFSIGSEGLAAFWFLFTIVILLQISSNTAHGAQQGLIPDLVPPAQRGRFSGVKALLEVPLPLIIVSFTVSRLIGSNNLWGGLAIAAGVLFGAMLLTLLAPEKPLNQPLAALDWGPLARLAGMTALFTAVILGLGQIVRLAGVWLAAAATQTVFVISLGLIGLAAMILAIGLGVWFSIRLSLGPAASANPAYSWWVINRLAFLVGATNLSTFAVYFLQARLGYLREAAAQPASVLLLVVGLFILFATLPGGWLADRFGPRLLVALSGLVAALGTAIALSVPNLNIIYFGGCFIGLAIGVFFTANWALGTSLVPKAEAGRYLGISNLAGAGAGAVGAYIGGPIADIISQHTPQVPGLGYVILFGIYGMLFLCSILAVARVR